MAREHEVEHSRGREQNKCTKHGRGLFLYLALLHGIIFTAIKVTLLKLMGYVGPGLR